MNQTGRGVQPPMRAGSAAPTRFHTIRQGPERGTVAAQRVEEEFGTGVGKVVVSEVAARKQAIALRRTPLRLDQQPAHLGNPRYARELGRNRGLVGITTDVPAIDREQRSGTARRGQG